MDTNSTSCERVLMIRTLMQSSLLDPEEAQCMQETREIDKRIRMALPMEEAMGLLMTKEDTTKDTRMEDHALMMVLDHLGTIALTTTFATAVDLAEAAVVVEDTGKNLKAEGRTSQTQTTIMGVTSNKKTIAPHFRIENIHNPSISSHVMVAMIGKKGARR